jgi:uroporphyrinogen-III synthase
MRHAASNDSAALANWTIVVTRPQPAAARTAAQLRVAGASVLEMPLLDITSIEPSAVDVPKKVDVAIFVSSHAAEHGAAYFTSMHATTVYAIGAATAAALRAAGAGLVGAAGAAGTTGFGHIHTPTAGEDSEALLAEPALTGGVDQPIGSVAIFRGESEAGGRRMLAEELSARGARVTEVVCYRRQPRVLSPIEAAQLVEAVHAGATVLVGSVETLDALAAHVALSTLKLLLVPHSRVAAEAKRRGVAVTKLVSLADNKLLASLVA